MYGAFYFPQIPFSRQDAGVDLGTAIVLPTGGNIVYLRSTGPADFDPPALTGRIVQTLNEALAQCRSGKVDTIIVLPGHSESVTATAAVMTNLVAGTRIIGIGQGAAMPTFRWTATGSQWAIAVNDVLIKGLRLRLEGANGVVKAINITGTDVTITGCDIQVASGASNKATIAIEIGSAADRTSIVGNRIRGSATHNVTNCIKLVDVAGVGGADAVTIASNRPMIASATAANGLINVQAACTNLYIADNDIYNTMTSSTATINVANTAADGIICRNMSGILTDGVASNTGIVLGGAATIKCFENYTSDEAKRSGALSPGVVTT